MLKQTLFLILLLFITVHEASARTPILSHEDYVHMTDQEKDQLIMKTMELAVDVEARYEKDLETYGFNQNRYEKYVEALTTLSKIFLDEAYADAGKDWQTTGKEFIQLLKRPDSRCMFAGWISTPSKVSPGKTVCNHPGNLAKSAPEAKAYPTPQKNADCKAGDPKKIQCSPVLFGYKKEADQSLFCVDAANGAHNSAYNCMQEALAVGSSQKGDSKETRLKNLRERLAKNPDVFKGVQEFTYKTCVCEATDPSVNFNKEYHEYMRPHRTCYGLMEMMGETIICEDPKLPMDVSIFKSLRDFSKNKIIKGKDADAFYASFLKTEVMKAAPEEYNRLCADNGNGKDNGMQTVVVKAKKSFACTAVCEPQEDDKERPFKCTYHVKDADDKEGEDYELKTEPTELPKSKEDKVIEMKNVINKKERTFKCDLTFPEPEKKDDKKKPSLTIEYSSKEDKEYKIKAVPVDQGDWKLIWKTHKTAKKEEKNNRREVKMQVTETTDTSKEEGLKDKKDQEPKPKEAEENISEDNTDATEISRPRENAKYKVCAELRKDKEVVQANPACLDVDPIGEAGKADAAPAKPASRPGPFTGTGMPMQQPLPIRAPSDASALGIK